MGIIPSLKSLLPARDLGWNRVRAACALPSCHNKLMMRYVPGSRQGIFVRDAWYCSPDCFAAAARTTLALLFSRCVVEMPRNPRLSLGLALLSKDYLSEDRLRSATLISQRQGASLEATLLETGSVTEKQLAAARAVQWGYPVLAQDLSGQLVESDLPSALLRVYSAVPLHYSSKVKRLVLGFVHRVEHSLLQSIEQMTGFRAEPCFITPAEFSEQMERVAVPAGYEEALVEEPRDAAQMARKLGGFAVEISAIEARFAKCNSSIWVRIWGRRRTVDVVFAPKSAAQAAQAAQAAFSNTLPEVTYSLG